MTDQWDEALRAKMIANFEEKYIPTTESGCWLWLAAIHNGYGVLGVNRKAKRAHRVAYELFVGEIPEGLVLDHKCRVTCCVNPAHLEPVTQKENLRRGVRAINNGFSGLAVIRARQLAKTHCPQGHPYAGDNLYIKKNGGRECRECRKVSSSKGYKKWKSKHG